MAVSLVQVKSSSSTSNNVSVTLDDEPQEGNHLILCHHVRSTSPTVTLPTGFVQDKEQTRATAQRGQVASKKAGASEGTGFTVTLSASEHQTLTVLEYSGLADTDWFDAAGSGTGNAGDSYSTGTSDTTTQADALLVGLIALTGDAETWSESWTNSFTHRANVASGTGAGISDHAVADRVVDATGQFESATTSTRSPTRAHVGIIAAYKAADEAVEVTKTHTTNAALQETLDEQHTTNAALRVTEDHEHTTNAALQEAFTGEHTTDALVTIDTISGTVTLAGSPVEGAVVRAINQDTNATIETATDVNGNYSFGSLPGGLYHVVVEYQDNGTKYNALSAWDVESATEG